MNRAHGEILDDRSGGGPVLALEDVHKSFRHDGSTIDVIKGVDLLIGPGDTVALTGASGVGKSTLLNIMGTLEPPTKGRVRFLGREAAGLGEADLCRLRNREIGFVFQFHHLLPEFDALENTVMPALIARISKKEAFRLGEAILGKVGLGHRLRHRVGELSGGEQQRVAIARALIMNPVLLLADEPTGNLDRMTGEEIMELLLWLNRTEGLAVVVATHNTSLADMLSRRLEMVDGRVKEPEVPSHD
ncbi:MAG: ABC transporter ATP-binding protein [Desulfobacteraceae bacterium]